MFHRLARSIVRNPLQRRGRHSSLTDLFASGVPDCERRMLASPSRFACTASVTYSVHRDLRGAKALVECRASLSLTSSDGPKPRHSQCVPPAMNPPSASYEKPQAPGFLTNASHSIPLIRFESEILDHTALVSAQWAPEKSRQEQPPDCLSGVCRQLLNLRVTVLRIGRPETARNLFGNDQGHSTAHGPSAVPVNWGTEGNAGGVPVSV